ncbi:hypothetical protein [Spongiimicrobium salis]
MSNDSESDSRQNRNLIPSTKLVFVKGNQVYLKEGANEWHPINFHWTPAI